LLRERLPGFPMRVLGVTGGIATGKSTVTRMLADLGAPTISADALAHDLLAPGTPTTPGRPWTAVAWAG
jgi:dephospho-CoA kinase